MKLMLVIVRDVDDSAVIQRLIEQGFRVTRLASTGGFLRRGNATLLIGVAEEQVQTVIDLIKATCSPAEAGRSRATIFVVNAPYFEQI